MYRTSIAGREFDRLVEIYYIKQLFKLNFTLNIGIYIVVLFTNSCDNCGSS